MASELVQWTIYDHPADFPNNYVARQWLIGPRGVTPGTYAIHPHIEALRAYIQTQLPGAYCLTRSPNDDPVIVETWT